MKSRAFNPKPWTSAIVMKRKPDWRGRFDYASLSTDDLDHVSRFAILALSDAQGAEIFETPPPQR